MSVLRIPTSNDPFYVQRTDLEGREYVLQFDYSTRENCWYMQVSASDGTVLAAGVKLVCSWPLLYRYTSTLLPPGKMFVMPVTTDDSPPGLDDLAEGGRCELTYVTSDDPAARGVA